MPFPKGAHHTIEAKAKMSLARRGKPLSETHRQALTEANRHHAREPARLAKLRASGLRLKGNPALKAACRERSQRADYLLRQSLSHTGKIHSVVSRKKIGDSLRGKAIPAEQRAKISAALKGRVFTHEHREKMKQARLGKPWPPGKNNTYNLNWLTSFPKPPTVLEKSLYGLLTRAGFDFQPQVRFGRYIVDAYVPSYGLAFEADGSYWHQDKQREARRDTALRDMGLVMVHLGEDVLGAVDLQERN